MQKFLPTIAGLAAGFVFASAIAAGAVVITPGATPGADQPNPIADSTTGTVFENVVGSVSGVRRSPWEGTSLEATGLYTSISANSSATYVFGSAQKAVSFLWGSPDTYNNLDISLSAGGTEIVNGALIQPPVAIGQKYVTLSGVGAFDSVTFRSNQNAFEFANLETTPVPLPAGVLLLGGALAGLGAVRRRMS